MKKLIAIALAAMLASFGLSAFAADEPKPKAPVLVEPAKPAPPPVAAMPSPEPVLTKLCQRGTPHEVPMVVGGLEYQLKALCPAASRTGMLRYTVTGAVGEYKHASQNVRLGNGGVIAANYCPGARLKDDGRSCANERQKTLRTVVLDGEAIFPAALDERDRRTADWNAIAVKDLAVIETNLDRAIADAVANRKAAKQLARTAERNAAKK